MPARKPSELRGRMVREQIAGRGVCDRRVLEAMLEVPRHRFVPGPLQREAYEDHPVKIGRGQTISQPFMVGHMTELLSLAPRDRVLEIGTGSGYQTAILAKLAAQVVSIERDAALAERAKTLLGELGITNAAVHTGDGSLGRREAAPFDAILVTAGAPAIPATLLEQLAVGGRLVCPSGTREVQKLTKVMRGEQGYTTTESVKCVFVPLVGAAGWPAGTG